MLQQIDIDSEVLETRSKVAVYIPEEHHPKQRYPVIYLFRGDIATNGLIPMRMNPDKEGQRSLLLKIYYRKAIFHPYRWYYRRLRIRKKISFQVGLISGNPLARR